MNIEIGDAKFSFEFRLEKSFQSIVGMFPQYTVQALYAKAYGMPVDAFFDWVEEQERKAAEPVKHLRVTPKQWNSWGWHERVTAIEAGFSPGPTMRVAFEDLKRWLNYYGDSEGTQVTKEIMEDFDQKAFERAKVARMAKRELRINEEKEKKQRDRDEIHRLRLRSQRAIEKSEEHERRIRELESVIESAEEFVQAVSNRGLHSPRDIEVAMKMNAYYAKKNLL